MSTPPSPSPPPPRPSSSRPPLPARGSPPPRQQPPPVGALPYATPVPRRAMRPIFHWGMFGWSAALLGLWLALVLVVTPRMVQVFTDYELSLPTPTRLLFAVGRVMSMGFWVVLLPIPLVLGFVSGPMSPGGRRVLRMLLTLFFGAFVALAVVGLLVPLTQLIDALGSSRGVGR